MLAILVGASPGALASPGPKADLTYSAEIACPSEASFRDQVSARLGYDPFVERASRHVRVSVTSVNHALTGMATIAIDDAAPVARSISADAGSCSAVVSALATTVAIALDSLSPIEETPSSVAVVEPSSPSPDPTPTRVGPPKAVAHVAHEESNPRAETSPPPADLRVLAGLVASAGIAPAPTLGPQVGAKLGRSLFSFEVTLRAESTLGVVDTGSGDRVQSALFAASLSPCLGLRRWSACASLRAGGLEARASTVTQPAAKLSPFGAIVVSAAYEVAVADGWSMRPGLEVGTPIVSTSMMVDDRPIWDAPLVFGGATIAILGNLDGP